MILEHCAFNPKHDKCEVSQDGFIDLVSAYENHSIDGNIGADDLQFNGIEDPDSILGSPKDVFDSAHYRESIGSYTPPSNNQGGV